MLLLQKLPRWALVVLSLTLTIDARDDNGNRPGEGTTEIDGVPIDDVPTTQPARPFAQAVGDRTGWTATADSSQPGNEAQNVLDGNANTLWHTQYNPTTPGLPHTITIDMKTARYVNGLTYQPRQDGNSNGNWGQHKIYCSTDGNNFGAPLVIGTYRNDALTKTSVFASSNCRYIRVTIQTEVNGNPWSSAAEINILTAGGPPPGPSGVGSWGPTIDWPIVCVSLVILRTGKALCWSSWTYGTFGGSPGGLTQTATYDPVTQIVSQRTVTNTGHDMFCEGLSVDWNGRAFATGGNDNAKASFYDPGPDGWISAPNMLKGRGYQSQCTISDGRTFVIGGSWSGGQGDKNGELYSPNANAWYALPGCPVAPMLTADAQGVFRADNHGWLFAWKDRSVFQAGPSKAINWYGTGGTGSTTRAGNRAADGDSMNGNAVMYDAVNGKILTLGGAPNYQAPGQATVNAHIITLGAPNTNPTVTRINDMWYPRAFHNSVVLPDGQVFITGGQTIPQPFSDDTAQLTGEVWNPNGFHFVRTAPMPIPRTYHSTAILLFDATVLNAGGGLCGQTCATNHYDGQIYYPPYLFNGDGSRATRPVINSLSAGTVRLGNTFNANMNGPADSFAIIRLSSTTHTVNTDQRRIALTPTATNGNSYTLRVPADAGVAIPGYYSVWALRGGVPSVAQVIQVTL